MKVECTRRIVTDCVRKLWWWSPTIHRRSPSFSSAECQPCSKWMPRSECQIENSLNRNWQSSASHFGRHIDVCVYAVRAGEGKMWKWKCMSSTKAITFNYIFGRIIFCYSSSSSSTSFFVHRSSLVVVVTSLHLCMFHFMLSIPTPGWGDDVMVFGSWGAVALLRQWQRWGERENIFS